MFPGSLCYSILQAKSIINRSFCWDKTFSKKKVIESTIPAEKLASEQALESGYDQINYLLINWWKYDKNVL